LPPYWNLYALGAAIMFVLFCVTLYLALTLDTGADVLRDYGTSLLLTEVFVGVGCLFGICKESYVEETSQNETTNEEVETNEEPLPTYEEVTKADGQTLEKALDSRMPANSRKQQKTSVVASIKSDIEDEDLPTFEQAVHI